MTTDPAEHIEEMLSQVGEDVHRSKALLEMLDQYNTGRDVGRRAGFGAFFAMARKSCVEDLTMCLYRVLDKYKYEKPASLRGLFRHLEEHHEAIELQDPRPLCAYAGWNGAGGTLGAAEALRRSYQRVAEAHSNSIGKIRKYRDERVAHRDSLADSTHTLPSVEGFDQLVGDLTALLEVIWRGFSRSGIPRVLNNAQQYSISLRRLLEQLGTSGQATDETAHP